MSDTLTILPFVGMEIALVVLFAGLIPMTRSDEFNRKSSNRLMWLRVVFQGVASPIFILSAFIPEGGRDPAW
jgi:hypothetical protein